MIFKLILILNVKPTQKKCTIMPKKALFKALYPPFQDYI